MSRIIAAQLLAVPFLLRTAPAAHPAMREISLPLQTAFRELLPELF